MEYSISTYDSHTGTRIKRKVTVREIVPVNPTPNTYPYCTFKRREVLIGMDEGVVRLRYPDGSYSRVQYLEGAGNDLLCLCALFICGLVPPEVLADKLQEDFPEHEEAAAILREYSNVKNSEGKPSGT